ncbi:MAG: glycosyltransferase family 2 protein [Desulfovibrio sp.]|jgi:dolichol-phosphate mannosyltransferase|nr:glycosyltransferase family 2 protein [Desulfovibrio sp.]
MKNDRPKLLSVVSPAFCEASNIGPFLTATMEVLERIRTTRGLDWEIILVDDGSTDDTWERMRQETERRPHLRCLRFSRNFGKEAAIAAGLAAAKGDVVITLDSDLQHPPELIEKMLDIWAQGNVEIVDARKAVRQRESSGSRLFANWYYNCFKALTECDLKESSDFKLLDRRVVEAVKSLPERKRFFRGITAWMGFRHGEVLFEPPDRVNGQTRWSVSQRIALAVDSMTSFSSKPILLIWGLTAIFYIFSIVVGGEAIWTHIQGNASTGFTTVILLVLLTGSAIMTALCVLSTYIHQTFQEIKGRPSHLISDTAESADHAASDTP